jgi:RHS repeat-associated protein
MGRVSEQWQYTPLGGNNSYSLPYTYDYLGNMVTASDGYFHTYTYAYNNASRLTGLTTSTTPTTLLSGVVYTPAGKISSDTLGTSEVETYTYTNKNQLQAENTKLSATQTYAYSLTFAPDGDVTASTDSINGNWTYTYDPFNRLVGSNQNSGAAIYSYVYDRFGNRWQQNGPHTMIEAFTGNSSVNNNRMDGYAYDAAGNLLNDGTNFYTFDAENRIVEVQEGSASGPVLATYAYDADGRRVHRTGVTTDTCDNTGQRDYVYDLAGNWVLEVTSTGTACKYEIHAGSRHFVTDVDGNTWFDHSDWLGTMRLRNTYATPLSSWETCTSLPFGDGLNCPNGDQSTIHFTGKERDSESGLDNFGARYNASTMGRFMSPDPGNIGVNRLNPQSWNAYSYSLNNPLSLTDPTGLYVCEDSEKCDSKNDQAFAKSLADAQTAANNLTGDDKAAAQRAIDSYGAQGVDNGVNVRFDSNVTGGVTEVSGVANGDKSADNPTGQNINVTFNPNAVGGDFSGGLVGHEGSHVADASAWVASGFSPSMNPTNSTTEFNAYHVQFDIGNALLNMKAGPGGSYTGYFNVPPNGRVDWKKGDTFKVITPDLQQKLKENYQNLNSPAFTKGAVLQP